MSAATNFLMFDGAQMQAVGVLSQGRDLPEVLALYSDLGPEAEAIGPLLAPVSESAEALCRDLDAMDGVFATTRIVCASGARHLHAHLQSLRYLHTLGGLRYFLRCADNRAVLGLWQAVDGGQRSRLIGPASEWTVRDIAGKAVSMQGTLHVRHDAQNGPLTLRPEQFGALLDRSRPGELMAATLDAWTGDLPSYADRISCSERVYAWLQQSAQERTPLAPLVNAAMWRSGGRALDDPSFQDALRADEALGRPASILEWEL